MKRLAEEINTARTEVAKTESEVKSASQDREAENANFQNVVSDQRATQEILQKALQRLKDFYKKKLTGEGVADTTNAALKREVDAYAPGQASLLDHGRQTPPVKFNA